MHKWVPLEPFNNHRAGFENPLSRYPSDEARIYIKMCVRVAEHYDPGFGGAAGTGTETTSPRFTGEPSTWCIRPPSNYIYTTKVSGLICLLYSAAPYHGLSGRARRYFAPCAPCAPSLTSRGSMTPSVTSSCASPARAERPDRSSLKHSRESRGARRLAALATRMRRSQCGKKVAEVVAVASPRPRGVPKNPL